MTKVVKYIIPFINALPGYDDGPWEITADTVPADIARNLKKYAELNRAMTNRTA